MNDGNRDVLSNNVVKLQFDQLRNLTSPEEKANGVSTYMANFDAFFVMDLPTTANLRSYMGEYSASKRTKVHKAIRNTIEFESDRFINRNAGLTMVCDKVDINNEAKTISVHNPNVINGAQTQGELKRYFDELKANASGDSPGLAGFHVRVEIVVDPDKASVVETAIARNTSNPVKDISQAGKRGHLDGLAKAVGEKIRMSETDIDVIETDDILRLTRLLMPSKLFGGEKSPSERLLPYKNKSQCRSDFSAWYEARETDPVAEERYKFTLDMARTALNEAAKWEKHPDWTGNHLSGETKDPRTGRPIRAFRREKGKVVWVSGGIVYPMLAALSVFVRKNETNDRWELLIPSKFDDAKFIKNAADIFRGENLDPMAMGRSISAYNALSFYPEAIMDAAS